MNSKSKNSDGKESSIDKIVPPSVKKTPEIIKQVANLLIESSEDAIIAESLDGKIISWNPAAEKMFGYTAEEVIGEPMDIIGTAEKKEEFGKLIERVVNGEKIERYQTNRQRKDGKKITVSVTISPIKDEKGKIIGVSAIDRNISAKQESAGYARSLIEASLDPLVTISTEGKITDVNQATIKATGATRKELVGSVFSDYFTEPKKAEEGYKKVLSENIVRDYPLTIKSKEGKLMDVLYNASTYKDAAGNVIGVFAAARDITEQKQASQYARSLIEASVDPLVTISPDGKITDVNQATIQATGATREEMVGSVFSDYFTEPEKAEEGYKKVLNENIVRDYPLTIKSKEGKLMDVLYNASTYKDAEGKVIGVFAAARDITEQKQASQYARSLIEASLDPLVTISPEGKITDVNEATIKATGATREELVGSIFSDYFTQPEKAEEGYQTVLSKGSVSDYALTIKSKEGKLMDVLYNASVYKDDKGKVIGVFAAARDVTKSRQASQYARSLIEASVDPLVTISPEGKITDVNQATIQATGANREELIGSVFSNYFTEPTKAEAGYKKVLSENIVRDYPLTIKHKKGKLMDVLYNASVYKDVRGKVIGVFAAARDITEQKQASQYARSLIEASLDPLVTISADGKITDVNQATIDVTGVPKEQLIGSDFSLYFTAPDKARSGYQEAFKEGEVRDYLLTIRSRSGKETPVLYNASIYKDDKGKVLGVFAAAREIGKAELKAAKARELQRVSKQVVFKVIVSHKMSKGNVKLSEADAHKLNVDLVDNVTVKPTRQAIANRRFTALSMTNSRLAEGTIVISIPDSRQLGLEEEDTVYLTKAGAEEEVELVDVESYAGTPGEFDSPTLNSAKQNKEENEAEAKAATDEAAVIKEPAAPPETRTDTSGEEPVPATPAEEPAPETPAESSAPETPADAPAAEEPVPATPAEEPVPETPAEEPVPETPAEEPVPETPAEEPVPETPAAETPAESSADAPAEEPVPETPAAETPAESSAPETPAEEPVAETPAESSAPETPAEEPASEKKDTSKGDTSKKSSKSKKAPKSESAPAKNKAQKDFEAQIDSLRNS
jgi:PAS domain S-box-containing protein